MRRCVVALVVMVVSAQALARGGPSVPARSANDIAEEARIRAEVAAVSAEAAAAFDAGTAARDAGKFADAKAQFERARDLAPRLDHPHRRLCNMNVVLDQLDAALVECEAALNLAPDSAFNKSALASVLIARPSPREHERGLSLARDAATQLPDDRHTTQVWCRAIAAAPIPVGLVECTERLLRLDPDGLMANHLASVLALQQHDFDTAHWRLEKAHTAGMPQAVYDAMKSELLAAERKADVSILPAADEVIRVGGIALAVWLVLLVVLFAAGTSLSHRTLASISEASTAGDGSRREQRLRMLYRMLLAIAGVFFYLSIPVLLVAIVAAGIATIIVFDEMGGIPLVVIWLVGALVVSTILAILRSMFVRAAAWPPGKEVDFMAYPAFRVLLDQVAGDVGTRPVDKAYFVPGTEIGVTERGGLWSALRGARRERALVVGVAVFDGMKQVQLRSILAHEYGHFRNADTAGGGLAIAVRRSLLTLIERMAAARVAHFYNPVWWCVRAFYRTYVGISHGASRLQEVLADRWAVGAYGTAAFTSAYRHVVARSVEFDAEAPQIIQDCIDNELPLDNLYTLEPETKKPAEAIEAAIATALQREPTLYDTHPSHVQRLKWADDLAVARSAQPTDDAPVWDLFPDAEQLELAMTAVVREQLRAKGVVVRDE